MKAKFLTNQTPGGMRSVLGEILPLYTPKLIQIFPVYACNFRCQYCFHALPKEKRDYECDDILMDFGLFKKAIDDMKNFKGKIKMLRIAGLGEPLMHKNIADMVGYAKSSGIFENINIVTNALLLDEKLSLNLVDAGLDMLRISVQGVSALQYKEITGAAIDFDKFVDGIRIFYNNRRDTRVYIKIIDCAVKSEGDKDKFFDIFGDICDIISFEYMTPTVEGIDYEKISGGRALDNTQTGNDLSYSKICPMPFYMMQINPDGHVVPCCGWSIPAKLGNVKDESVADIWNSRLFNGFRALMLTKAANCGKICAACTLYRYGMFPEDNLDLYAHKLLPLYKNH